MAPGEPDSLASLAAQPLPRSGEHHPGGLPPVDRNRGPLQRERTSLLRKRNKPDLTKAREWCEERIEDPGEEVSEARTGR